MNGKRIESIKVVRTQDEYPDLSYLGEYGSSDKGEMFAIDSRHELTCNVNFGKFAAQEITDKLDRVMRYLSTQRKTVDTQELQPVWEAIGDAYTILDEAQDAILECNCDEVHIDRNSLEYFIPGSVETFKADASWIPADVEDKKAYWLAAMIKNATADYERMERYNNGDWCSLYIRAEADIRVNGISQEITSGGIGGTESDSDDKYLDELGDEELHDLKSQLSALGFSKRAIATAFKDVETVNE